VNTLSRKKQTKEKSGNKANATESIIKLITAIITLIIAIINLIKAFIW
jgi:hypothetical protein